MRPRVEKKITVVELTLNSLAAARIGMFSNCTAWQAPATRSFILGSGRDGRASSSGFGSSSRIGCTAISSSMTNFKVLKVVAKETHNKWKNDWRMCPWRRCAETLVGPVDMVGVIWINYVLLTLMIQSPRVALGTSWWNTWTKRSKYRTFSYVRLVMLGLSGKSFWLNGSLSIYTQCIARTVNQKPLDLILDAGLLPGRGGEGYG